MGSRYLWQIWEEGKVKALVSGLDRSTLIRGLQSKDDLRTGETSKKIKELIQYWRENRGNNNTWASKFSLSILSENRTHVDFPFSPID